MLVLFSPVLLQASLQAGRLCDVRRRTTLKRNVQKGLALVGRTDSSSQARRKSSRAAVQVKIVLLTTSVHVLAMFRLKL
jgi:hypothetical protein